ncbi:MAG: hypothetical protein AAF914_01365 [Pseudomonadota bacterium]
MTRALAATVATVPLLSGCLAGPSPEVAGAVAQAAVMRVYPGLSAEPVVGCILENATQNEVSALAAAADDVSAAQILTLSILDRPATDACLRTRGITLS